MGRRTSGTIGAILRAVGGILDLGATQRCYVHHERRYVPSATIHNDMLRDWTAVGDALREATASYERTHVQADRLLEAQR
jgi:hypothetical protein